jgi:hypothetical protein
VERGRQRGLLGAYLGHGPADNSRHERTVPDTPQLLFSWGNARCQLVPIDMFFPDTEEVTESMFRCPTWPSRRYK